MHISWSLPSELLELCHACARQHGRAYIVGGAVRDKLLERPIHDFDLEVHGVSYEKLTKILKSLGDVHEVGRQFGVALLKFASPSLLTVDVALPRTESKIGVGHKGFHTVSDPHMGLEVAVLRRDFTINTLMYDPLDGQLHDPTGRGLEDLKSKTLRHVSDAFVEDPLRAYRALQFAARFELTVADETTSLLRAMQAELRALPVERVYQEWRKLLLSPKPSIGLKLLKRLDFFGVYPELQALVGVEQDPEWHPEGDVWIHTLMVVDAAATIAHSEGLDALEHLILVSTALCHDLGKPEMTHFDRGRWRSPNHEKAGLEPTAALLSSIGMPSDIKEAVGPLVAEHLKPYQLYARRHEISDGAIRRLANRVDIKRLVRVAKADYLGRTTYEALHVPDPVGPWLMTEAERLKVKDGAPQPLVLGRHLIEAGLKPGPELGRVLKELFEAQLDGAFDTLSSGLAYFRSRGDLWTGWTSSVTDD